MQPAPSLPEPGRPVYLDASSALPLQPAARDTLAAALERGYGDPRRLHRAGRDARLLLDNARAVVAECLGAHPDEVSFTGSGTDAVHRGLLGLVHARRHGGRAAIVHPPVEHSAVLHAVAWAGRGGGEPDQADPQTFVVPVDAVGRVDPVVVSRLASRAAADGRVAAVALQAANHEIGTRQPVDDLDLPPQVPLFVDAAAAIGHGPLPRTWDALAGSARKWGGPAGIGVLALRRGTRWANPFPGEDVPEPDGFGNVPGALAAAAALQAVVADQEEAIARQHDLVGRIRRFVSTLADTEVVGDPDDRLPHLVTFSCLYVAGDELVSALDRRGFGAASGSACTASTLEPSHVLAAIGALTHGNVRVGLTSATTLEDVERFCAALAACLDELRGGLP